MYIILIHLNLVYSKFIMEGIKRPRTSKQYPALDWEKLVADQIDI